MSESDKPPLVGVDGGRKPKARGVSMRAGDLQTRIAPSEFAVPVSDSNGHSARIGTRVLPNVPHMIEVLIGNRNFGWTAQADFLRWAIHHGLNTANQLLEARGEPETRLSNLLLQTNAMVVIAQTEAVHAGFSEVINGIDRAVTAIIQGGGGPDQVRRLVDRVLREAESIDDPYWRLKYVKEIKRRFAHALQAAAHSQQAQQSDKEE